MELEFMITCRQIYLARSGLRITYTGEVICCCATCVTFQHIHFHLETIRSGRASCTSTCHTTIFTAIADPAVSNLQVLGRCTGYRHSGSCAIRQRSPSRTDQFLPLPSSDIIIGNRITCACRRISRCRQTYRLSAKPIPSTANIHMIRCDTSLASRTIVGIGLCAPLSINSFTRGRCITTTCIAAFCATGCRSIPTSTVITVSRRSRQRNRRSSRCLRSTCRSHTTTIRIKSNRI